MRQSVNYFVPDAVVVRVSVDQNQRYAVRVPLGYGVQANFSAGDTVSAERHYKSGIKELNGLCEEAYLSEAGGALANRAISRSG